jgi:uncharacterized membrane protein YphA (DoxX/SURF4 family)
MSHTPHRAARRPPSHLGRAANTALWVLQIAAGLFFIGASAFPKLIGHDSARVGFDAIGYGDWFMYLIGTLELAGGIALMIPVLSGLAALCFMALMVGAFTYEVTVIESGFWYTPVIIFAVMAVIAWGRRDSLARLLGAVRRR